MCVCVYVNILSTAAISQGTVALGIACGLFKGKSQCSRKNEGSVTTCAVILVTKRTGKGNVQIRNPLTFG